MPLTLPKSSICTRKLVGTALWEDTGAHSRVFKPRAVLLKSVVAGNAFLGSNSNSDVRNLPELQDSLSFMLNDKDRVSLLVAFAPGPVGPCPQQQLPSADTLQSPGNGAGSDFLNWVI